MSAKTGLEMGSQGDSGSPAFPDERVTTIGAPVEATCLRCGGRDIRLVQLGSETDLVRCEACGFSFGWEQFEV